MSSISTKVCWNWVDNLEHPAFDELTAYCLGFSIVQWRAVWRREEELGLSNPILYATPNVIRTMQSIGCKWATWIDIRESEVESAYIFHDNARYRVAALQDMPWIIVDPDCFVFPESVSLLKPWIEKLQKEYRENRDVFYYYQQDVYSNKFHAFPYLAADSRTVRKVLLNLDYPYRLEMDLEEGGNLGFCMGTPRAGYLIGTEVVNAQNEASSLRKGEVIKQDECSGLHHWLSGLLPWYVAKRFNIPFEFLGWDVNSVIWHTCGGTKGLPDIVKGNSDEERRENLKEVFKALMLRIGNSGDPVSRKELEFYIKEGKVKELV